MTSMLQNLRIVWHNFLDDLKNGPPTKPSDRRKEVREALSDSSAEIDESSYPVQDWSRSACCIRPADFEVTVGYRLEARFVIATAEETFRFTSRIVVLRIDKEAKVFAASFLNLSDHDRKVIDAHFNNLRD